VATAENVLRRNTFRSRLAAHPEIAALVHTSKGVACVRAGSLREAADAFADGARSATEAGGCAALEAECLGFLALLEAVMGRLTRADELANRAVKAWGSAGVPAADRPPATQVALAWTRMEMYDIHAAVDHLRQGQRSRFFDLDPVARAWAAVVASRVQRARGDVPGAIAALAEGEDHLAGAGRWLGDRLQIEAATLQAAENEPGAVDALLDAMDAVGNEAEIALAQAQLRRPRGGRQTLGDELRPALAVEASLSIQVTALLMEVERFLELDDPHRADLALQRSLRIAAPERLRRPFREAAPAVQGFVSRSRALGAGHTWLEGPGGGPARPTPALHGRSPVRPQDRDLALQIIQPLTKKEQEVLGYLADLLSTTEIAEAMFVSVNTVRTHVRSILRKLGVSRRNQAVRRARELEILARRP
jgi:LuxR family transcriptional regulator, maltose regulon positive regulatory protein